MQMEEMLASQGMAVEEIECLKEREWSFFLKNCRRRVPSPERLLKRFQLVVKQFENLADAKTGEKLLRPLAMAAIARLEGHIKAGCLSDPEGVAMYYANGKAKSGLTTYRCVRGTNDTEVSQV